MLPIVQNMVIDLDHPYEDAPLVGAPGGETYDIVLGDDRSMVEAAPNSVHLVSSVTGASKLVSFSLPLLRAVYSVTRDAAGDYWFASHRRPAAEIGPYPQYLFKVTAAAMHAAANGEVLAPSVVLTMPLDGGTSTGYVLRVRFDAAGNLWAMRHDGNWTFYKFAPGDVLASGSPAPLVKVTPEDGWTTVPQDFDFLPNGDMVFATWTTGGPCGLFILQASQLAASSGSATSAYGDPGPYSTLVPFKRIGGRAQPVNNTRGYCGIALDPSNRECIWAVGYPPALGTGNALYRYRIDQFVETAPGDGNVDPTPDIMITCPQAGDIDGPIGIGFDHDGNLWWSNYDNNATNPVRMAMLGPAKYGKGGSVEPDRRLLVSPTKRAAYFAFRRL